MATKEAVKNTQAEKGKENIPAKTNTGTTTLEKGPMSERFTHAVIREFGGTVGKKVELGPYQQVLAQHLFLKIDAALQELERKRTDANKPPIVWANVNMQKLAVDAMHRIELGLDALIENHISPIPYLNGRTKQYDLDLRVGYVGKDFYRRQMSIEPPIDIRYELVHANDKFTLMKKSYATPVESYQFDVPTAFDRGPVVGGFAYIMYADATKNEVIIVSDADFKKSESKAQSKEFWTGYPDEMKYKTLVNRTTSKLQIDPRKVNAAFVAVEKDEETDAARVRSEIDDAANKGEVLEIEGSEQAGTAPAELIFKCPDKDEEYTEAECEKCKQREGCPSHPEDEDGNGKAAEPSKSGRMPGF